MTVTEVLLTTAKETPINVLLSLVIFYLVWDILFPKPALSPSDQPIPSSYEKAYAWRPKTHQPVILYQRYTPKTLQKYNGKDDEKILLGINRVVYDVTGGRSFYGPEGPYGNFAGRDASRGMAKQSFDLEMLTPVDGHIDPLTDLTPAEIENMNGWSQHFQHKYTVCGELVENDAL